jgi:hypothetical protein
MRLCSLLLLALMLCPSGGAEAHGRHHNHAITHSVMAGRPSAWCSWEMRQLVGRDPGPSYNLARNWSHWGSAASGPGRCTATWRRVGCDVSEIVVAETKRALYFGCLGEIGHYLHDAAGNIIWEASTVPGFPWSGRLDSGLLKNGRCPDVYDGKVFWTCGGTPLWLAFFWWDNSVDRRSGSNSGFYVQGFDHEQAQAALEYACSMFPEVVARQRQPLALQLP